MNRTELQSVAADLNELISRAKDAGADRTTLSYLELANSRVLKPYVVTVWAGGEHTVGRFQNFSEALSCYNELKEPNRLLVNSLKAYDGLSGLTEDERNQLIG